MYSVHTNRFRSLDVTAIFGFGTGHSKPEAVTFFSLEGSSTDAAALETSRARAAAEIERIVSSSAAPW